jgi:hypothetical protein
MSRSGIDWEQYAVQPNGNQQQQAPQAPQASQAPQDLGALHSLLRAFNTGAEGTVAGVLQPLLSDKFSQNKATDREQQLRNLAYHNPTSTAIGHTLGQATAAAPAYAIGGAGQLLGKGIPFLQKLLMGAKTGAIGGALTGGAQYVNPGESRLENTLQGAALGAGLGSAFPVVGKGASLATDAGKSLYRSAKGLAGSKDVVASDLLQNIPNGSAKRVLQTKQAGERLGINLTPAEASGHPLAKATERGLGSSPEGAQKITDFRQEQRHLQKNAIDELLDVISPKKGSAAKDIRTAASDIIKNQEQKMKDKAAPLYAKVEKEIIEPNKFNSLLRDSNIEQSYRRVTESPLYRSELKGLPVNSIKVVDTMKKDLWDRAEALRRKGKNEGAAILDRARHKLVNKADELVPGYKKARDVYTEGSPAIKALYDSPVGKIAGFEERSLKHTSKAIFDPSETNLDILKDVRKVVEKQNPDAWAQLVRGEMERRIDVKSAGGVGKHGSNFYKNVLSSDKDFAQFQEALKGNKEAQQKLKDMRLVFRNIINQPTPKLKDPSGSIKTFISPALWKETAHKLANGRYDKAAVELVTSGKWDEPLRKALAAGTQEQKAAKVLPILKEIASKGTQAAIVTKATQTQGSE